MNYSIPSAITAVVLISLTAPACERAEETAPPETAAVIAEHHEAAESEPSFVTVSEDQRAALGIEVVAAAPARIDATLMLLGDIEANGDHLAHIVPRYAGIAREVRKVAGDSVRAGDVLAVIESSDSLVRYELKTLIAGVVLAKDLTIGEAVTPERQTFVIADLSTVWVDLAVYQKDLAAISLGQAVRIHAVQPGPDAEGTVSYITPVVDPATRTATARVVLPNPDRKWLPGMFVTGHPLDPRAAAVAIPPSAIQMLDGRSTVFVETAEGFTPRAVTLGRQGETLTEIVAGLSPDERVVSKNSFLIKAELAKGEAEEE